MTTIEDVVGRVAPEPLDDTHPAVFAPMQARVDYACVVAAFLAEGTGLDGEASWRLQDLCREIALPPHLVDRVFASPYEDRERLQGRLLRLRASDLRHRLVRDLVALGFADGRYEVSDRRAVRGLAAVMLVGEDVVAGIEDQVVAELEAAAAADDPAEAPAPEEVVGTWAGVRSLYRRLLATLTDD